MMRLGAGILCGMPGAICLVLMAVPATAQDQPGRIADSSVGEVGQRQTRDQLVSEPLARINSRIQNRIESRIANRIDRFYNNGSQTSTSAYDAAGQRVRRPARSR